MNANANPPAQSKKAARQITGYEAMIQRDAALWNSMVNQAQDPVVARAMLELFEAHPELKAKRAGAFLAARVTVQKDRIRYAKAFRQGQRLGAVIGLLGRVSAVVARSAVQGAKVLTKQAVQAVASTGAQSTPAVAPQEPTLKRQPAADPVVVSAQVSAEVLPFPVIDWNAFDTKDAKSVKVA